MHPQLFNFTPLEELLLVKVKEIRKGKKQTEDVDTALSHTSNDDDKEGSDDLTLQALIHKSRAEYEESMIVVPEQSSKSTLEGNETQLGSIRAMEEKVLESFDNIPNKNPKVPTSSKKKKKEWIRDDFSIDCLSPEEVADK